MDLKSLEAFLAVMTTGNITGAAQVLGRSQPVVTRQIQELEARIGFKLFRRNGPRITPTQEAIRFHVEVERLMAGLTQLAERAEAIAGTAPLAIEISAVPALAAGLLPRAIAMLDPALLPNSITLHTASAEQTVQSVLARTSDIGVSSLPLDHPGLELHRLYQSPCRVALAEDDPLAKKPLVSIADFAGRRLIGMANPFRLQRRVTLALSEAGIAPSATLHTNSTLNALQLARQGVGLAIVEPVTALGVPMAGVAIRPLDVAIPFLWGVATALNAALSPSAEALIAHLDAAARELLPDLETLDPADSDRLNRSLYGALPSPDTDDDQ